MELNQLKIPKERVAVLIGRKGQTKQTLEQQTNTEIEVDSKTGLVEIKSKNDEPFQVMKAHSVIKAIARGFSPEHALQLLDDEFILDVIDLKDLVGKSEKAIEQKKGRVIGKKGSTRKKIEEDTETFISVYGKTISIIGRPEKLETARKAVMMLIEGAPHNKVYDFLERKEKFKLEL
jgi:ribosomal RNA assembly protein